MGALFSPPKPKGPDAGLIAAQQAQLAAERERAADLKAQEDSRLRALLGRSSGRVALLGGGEAGVSDQPKEKLG